MLGYPGYALKRKKVSWFSGVKITFRSYRSPQPRYRGQVMQRERVFRDADVNIIFRSFRSSAAKMLNIWTLNGRRFLSKEAMNSWVTTNKGTNTAPFARNYMLFYENARYTGTPFDRDGNILDRWFWLTFPPSFLMMDAELSRFFEKHTLSCDFS